MRQVEKWADFRVARDLLAASPHTMRLPAPFRPIALAAAALFPALAHAHPGHDGGHDGGLTWDFIGDVLHRLSSPYHLAPVCGAAVLTLVALRIIQARRKRATSRGIGHDRG